MAGARSSSAAAGRCNVLPRAIEPDRFVSDSPRPLVRRLLRSWPLEQQIAFFERDLGIPLKMEADAGKYFPVSDRARDIRDRLMAKADRSGAKFQFETRLTDLVRHEAGWSVQTTSGLIEADAVIIATGGRSVPADRQRRRRIRSGQTPWPHDSFPRIRRSRRWSAIRRRTFRWPGSHSTSGCARNGRANDRIARRISLHASLATADPAVLDVSHVAVRSEDGTASIRVRWCDLDAAAWTKLLTEAAGQVLTAVAREIPTRLAERLLVEAQVPLDRRASSLTRVERLALIDRLTSYELRWTGDEGYKKAEVTGGGIALDEVDPRTLESRVAPGNLFLRGNPRRVRPDRRPQFRVGLGHGRAAGQHA
jgi:predicted flavoprotein YhiN